MLSLTNLFSGDAVELHASALTPSEVEEVWNAAVNTIKVDGRDTLSSYILAFRGRVDLWDKRIATLEEETSARVQRDELRWIATKISDQQAPVHSTDEGDGQNRVSIPAKSFDALVDVLSKAQGLENELESLRHRRRLLVSHLEVMNSVLFEDVVFDSRRDWSVREPLDPFEGLEGRAKEYVETFVTKILRAISVSERPPSQREIKEVLSRGKPKVFLNTLWEFIASDSMKADGTRPGWETVRDRFQKANDPNSDGKLFNPNDPVGVVLERLYPIVLEAFYSRR